jgi:hypothetical protein
MAQSGPIDITFNEFKNLPTEIKVLVLAHIPIKQIFKNKLVDDVKVGSVVDEYIKYYIDTKLFTNAFIFTYLTRIKLYDIIIGKKLFEMGNDFIKECKRLDETPRSEKKNINIFFDIKYKNGSETIYHCKNGTDFISFFRYQMHGSHVLVCVGCSSTASQIDYMSGEILRAFYYLMTSFKKIKLQSIELVETTYTKNHIFVDLCDSHKGDFRVIKKYY